MTNKIIIMEITQPIGCFYIGKLNAKNLIKITKTSRRSQKDGIQRDLSIKRANDIKKYCEDPDATFPTPIILSINTKDVNIVKSDHLNEIYIFEYDPNKIFAEILDGQHRVEGIKINNRFNFELPIVIMFDLTEEEKAYVFSTINSNQTKVDKSLIYDLFDLSKKRSPYKSCHELARILNSSLDSPFYLKLKMLGKKTTEIESLSQGTFVTHLCRLISKDPKGDMINIKNGVPLNDNKKLPFRNYFINDKDEIILKIIENYFNAVQNVFYHEWNNPDNYILSKTTGFGALLIALKTFYFEGREEKNLTQSFFEQKLEIAKNNLNMYGVSLTSAYFPSNASMQNKLAKMINNTFLNENN